MNWFIELGRRLLMLFRRRQFDRDLDEELRLRQALRLKKHGLRRGGDLGTKSY
jgi:hypothetical protein